MAIDMNRVKWNNFVKKKKKIVLWGMKHHKVSVYSDYLIEKLRNVYYGGVPASITLLCKNLTNGYCYDRALLMSRAFLDDEAVDVNLIYASVNSLRLNPEYKDGDDMTYDHCFVEFIRGDRHYIIDTSIGLIYEKDLYWKIEQPIVRKINNKQSIIDFMNNEEIWDPEDIERDKYAMPFILPNIEYYYRNTNEYYNEQLKKEIDLFKEKINYEEVANEVDKGYMKFLKRGNFYV